jgi:hypothetical protein
MISKKRNYTKILSLTKRLKSINVLGGKCNLCGNSNWYNLDFHHPNGDKENTVSNLLIGNYSWRKIEIELNRCELLCSNCHREYHFNISQSKDERRITKKILLDYKGNKCEKCGYNKCQSGLTFHHLDPSKKDFNFSEISVRAKSLQDLNDNIIKELDKCSLLCANCHREEHTDIDFYIDNKKEIINKLENMVELRKPVDPKIVIELYNSGMRQIDIVKKLDVLKSTVSRIINIEKSTNPSSTFPTPTI